MPRNSKLCGALAALALALAQAAPASGRGGGGDETQRWVPAAGIGWAISGWHSEASSASAVRPSASGSERLANPLVLGTLELATPAVPGVVGSPRLFGHADVGASFASEYDVAKEGAPGKLELPTSPTTGLPTATFEAFVLGQGSVTRIEWNALAVGAGIGVALTGELGGWRFRIKPSAEYLRQELEASGIAHRAISLAPANIATTNFRLIELRGQRTRVYHSLGPGIELELDAARFGPSVMSVFVSGQAYAALGKRDIDFAASFSDASGTERATWHFEPAAWFYRGALGFRLRFAPERSAEDSR